MIKSETQHWHLVKEQISVSRDCAHSERAGELAKKTHAVLL